MLLLAANSCGRKDFVASKEIDELVNTARSDNSKVQYASVGPMAIPEEMTDTEEMIRRLKLRALFDINLKAISLCTNTIQEVNAVVTNEEYKVTVLVKPPSDPTSPGTRMSFWFVYEHGAWKLKDWQHD